MRFLLILLINISIVISGCATSYSGPKPNLNLRGAAAENEIKKFEIQEGFWDQSPDAFQMGNPRKLYYISSLEPVIKEISPSAWQKTEGLKVWRTVQNVFFCAAVGLLVYALLDDVGEFSKDQSFAYFSLLGVSAGFGIYRAASMSSAAKEYNRDLKSKFTPSVSFNYSY